MERYEEERNRKERAYYEMEMMHKHQIMVNGTLNGMGSSMSNYDRPRRVMSIDEEEYKYLQRIDRDGNEELKYLKRELDDVRNRLKDALKHHTLPTALDGAELIKEFKKLSNKRKLLIKNQM